MTPKRPGRAPNPQYLAPLPILHIWKWKQLEANNLISDVIFTVERVRTFIGGVGWCLGHSRCWEGHVVGRLGIPMQLN
jgi:hypothetical protein